MKKAGFLIMTVLILVSCFNNEIGKSYEKADSLSVMIKKVDNDYKSIDYDKIKEIYDTIKIDVKVISQYMVSLPKNEKHKNAFNIYSDVAKQTKHFLKQNYSYFKDIEYSIKQINNLKIDISNEALPIDSIKKYLNDEQKSIYDLKDKIDSYAKTAKQIEEKYFRAKSGINDYIDSLKQNYQKLIPDSEAIEIEND